MGADTKGHLLTHDDVVSVVGQLADAKIADIIATGATLVEVEEAMAFASGENDVMGDLRLPAVGRVAEVYDILMATEPYEEDEAP
ncbi:MAG: hypothetical protein GY789_17125 [Hyphomicrobiales bacterium]|nr:hypothetical protein [Hyphomicrobiales bacterium]